MKLSVYENELAVQHLLVFGDPGTGKSTLVSQLAEAGYNLLWFSFDNGHSVLKKLSPAAQERVELVVVPDTRDYPVAVDVFRTVMKYVPTKICYRHGKAGCTVCMKDFPADFTEVQSLRQLPATTIVVFDNLSQLSDSYMSLICKDKPVDYKLQLDDWGSLLFHMKKALMDIQQAPFNLAAIAHAVEEAITDSSKKIMPAIGSSQFAPKVGGYFDHVIYTSVLNKSHRAGSASTYQTNVITKSRSDISIETSGVGGKQGTSLVPFFDGTIKSRSTGIDGSKQGVVNGEVTLKATPVAAEQVAPAVQHTTPTPVTQITKIVAEVINRPEVKEQITALISQTANNSAPADEDSPAARARRALANMKKR